MKAFTFIFISLLTVFSHCKGLKQAPLSLEQAVTLMKKYQPVFYFHPKENNFPTAIEDFNIDWTSVQMNNINAKLDTKSFQGNTSPNPDAPIYCSVKNNPDGTISITYVLLFGFSGEGPDFYFSADIAGGATLRGLVLPGSSTINYHYSDVIQFRVNLKSDFTILNTYYQDMNKQVSNSWSIFPLEKFSLEGDSPVVYVAKGSHKCYRNINAFITYLESYKEVYNGKYLTTAFIIRDKVARGTRWQSTNPKLMKLNGKMVGNPTPSEQNLCFNYNGYLGTDFSRLPNWNKFSDDVKFNTFASNYSVYPISVAKMKDAINSMSLTFNSAASQGFSMLELWK